MRSALLLWSCAALLATAAADGASSPQALLIPASEYFEGNDGPWSTFNLRVGAPAQYVRVLVSTASPQSMVVLSSLGCTAGAFGSASTTVPADCASARGGLFNPNQSSTWRGVGTYGINQDGVGLEANLGYAVSADFGLDTVGIGLTGPNVTNSTVGAFATAEPFYLGIFGLNNQPVNFSSLGNTSTPTFFTALKDQGLIPSLSWSYTAGAQYRLKQVYGQLIFSGYDTSRFAPNNLTFTMAGDTTRDLVVALQQITYTAPGAPPTTTTLLSTPIDIFIDSTDPNLWLPPAACDAFESAFGLAPDAATGLYLVNATHRARLVATNASVTFTLSNTVGSGGDAVAVTLPYAAFDKTAGAPLVVGGNGSYYFPLVRANSSAQYTLGRTFLQEAYLSADYERKTFNLSSCVWNADAEQSIQTVLSTSPASSSSSSSSSRSGLSKGAIAGIAVGSAVLLLLLLLAGLLLLLRKRRKWMGIGFSRRVQSPGPSKSVLDGPVFNSDTTSGPPGASYYGSPAAAAAGAKGDNSSATPASAGDVVSWPGGGSGSGTGTGSGTQYSRSANASRSPGQHEGDDAAAAAAAGVAGGIMAGRGPGSGSRGDNKSTPELDAEDTHVRPTTELDAQGTQIGELENGEPVSRVPGVYELPGSRVPQDVSSETDTDSPDVSTMDSQWWRDHPEVVDPDHMVSPTSTHRGRRHF